MRVLIVDDHSFVRKGLLHVLQHESGETVESDETASFDDAVIQLQTGQQYDLVLLDISLGGRSGLELLQFITRQYPDLPVLMISMHPEEQYALRCIKMGAAGYLSKLSAPDELINAVQQIRTHGAYISPGIARIMTTELGSKRRTEAVCPHDLLTNREMEVAVMIASGKSMRQIAEDLHLSIKTVNTHRTRLLKKMQLANNAELAAYFIRNRLLQ
jgi:DNA-binding NarL/FixJ family response regulator